MSDTSLILIQDIKIYASMQGIQKYSINYFMCKSTIWG